ncbi:MAG: hypothetical protein H6741_27730 [Alphaproteobacteria bacterium]|nr:hypothetical protein [Alphaproteobacteria bacterium]
MLLLVLLACKGDPAPSDSPGPEESVAPVDSEPEEQTPQRAPIHVQVTLDGEPVEGATVLQGGLPGRYTTDAEGQVSFTLDASVEGDVLVMAGHPDARTQGDFVWEVPTDGSTIEFELALERFSRDDNLEYVFQDPGAPDIEDTTAQCSHCHVSIVEDWWASPHRQSASNAHVQDLYAGAAGAYGDAGACGAAGGLWLPGLTPGTREEAERCYLGDGALPDLNPGCGEDEGCELSATAFGACADCHAPGIDGALGGRDLLEAEGIAHDKGVHCDVCHRVEAVDLSAPAGVAGRLALLRPSEEDPSPVGDFIPLTFGPYDDVPNPRMGSVQRDHFREATLCAGCHELEQAALIPGQALDSERWPEGVLPVHTTYSEWLAGPMSPGVVCQSCHMPTDAAVGNSADLGNQFDIPPGIAGGWYRTPGEVRQHVWVGPRQPDSRMLQLAATVDIDAEVEGGQLTAEVTVQNAGPGHAIPTGEPLRSLLLVVEARCEGALLEPTGGDVISDVGGALEVREADEDWEIWPSASAGERLRVVSRPGGWVDYAGYGPFGDGTFTAEQKGLPLEAWAGESEILSVDSEGRVTLDVPLAEGALVYRVRAGSPEAGAPALTLAGAPGQAFARVLVDAEGRRMVPHHRAVDVASDNRLQPRAQWTSTHVFEASCEAPEVRAVLLHRAFPLELAEERGWDAVDSVMVEARR